MLRVEVQQVPELTHSARVHGVAPAAAFEAAPVVGPTLRAFPVDPSVVCFRQMRIPVMAVDAVILLGWCFLAASVTNHR